METFLETTCLELKKRGHDVSVLCGSREKAEDTEVQGIRVVKTPYLFRNSHSFLESFRSVDIGDVDVIHTHNMFLPISPEATLGVFNYAKEKNTPVLQHLHNPVLGDYDLILARELVSMPWDGTIAVSRYVRDEVERSCNVKAQVVYNSVDTSLFDPVKSNGERVRKRLGLGDSLVVLCPSRVLSPSGKVDERKRLDLLISAFSDLDRSLDAKLVLNTPLGYGMSLKTKRAVDDLKRQVEKQGVSDRVVFNRESINYGEMRDYYAAADVVALPSVNEPLGIVYLEGMSMEKPVVGCMSGGVPEIVETGRDGLLVRPDDVGELSNALEKLLSDDSLRKEMGKAGREKVVGLFSVEKIVAELEEYYGAFISV